jgi:hypothetical protein
MQANILLQSKFENLLLSVKEKHHLWGSIKKGGRALMQAQNNLLPFTSASVRLGGNL